MKLTPLSLVRISGVISRQKRAARETTSMSMETATFMLIDRSGFAR